MQELWSIYHHEIPEFLCEFAAVPPMQRLKAVGMNCGCEYTSFPRFAGLRPYSRFDHSLGTALIIWHSTGNMEQTLAGLFHDVTTPVFAHVVDFLHGDHMKQESTEAGVAECLMSSDEAMELLRKYDILLDRVIDYHQYPVADNDAPALSADRLEYTLGNLWNYGFADLEQIRAVYEDLTVGRNETGETELAFRTPETAVLFTRAALKNSHIYVADEDRFAMQALADLLRRAIECGVIRYEQLWTTENVVLKQLTADAVFGKEWKAFTQFSHLLRSSEKPEHGYWVHVSAKKRWIDPYVIGAGRVSSWNALAEEEIKDLKNLSFDIWLSAEADRASEEKLVVF